MNNELMFSSKTDLWATPSDFFEKLNDVFKFDLDACAIPENAKCDRFFSPEVNGLNQAWSGNVWMNPSYGRGIGEWVEKAYRSSKENAATVVCLLPARTDTRWWHDYCAKGEIHFVKGRLKFGNAVESAPFPSAVVVFRPSLSDVFKNG